MKNLVVMDCDGTLVDDSSLAVIGESYWTAENFAILPDHKELIDIARSVDKGCLIILTGRSDAFYDVTMRWVNEHVRRDFYLIMRPAAMHYSEAVEFKYDALMRIVHDVNPDSLSLYDDDKLVLAKLQLAKKKCQCTFGNLNLFECRNGVVTKLGHEI